MYYGGESIPHGQDSSTPVVSNRGGYAIHSARPIFVYYLGPQELVAFNAIRAAREHQGSRGPTPVDAVGNKCDH